MTAGRKPMHGHASRRLGVSPEYKVWEGIRERCHNPNSKDYPRYGGRGITVCPQWLSSFSTYLADMGTRPSPQHSIERIKNHLGYEPGNCKWATREEQSRNRRTNKFVELDGERLCVTDAAIAHGLSPNVVVSRLRIGWQLERALTTPVARKRRDPFIERDGKRVRAVDVAVLVGFPLRTLARRLRQGWDAESALTTPVDPSSIGAEDNRPRPAC